MSAAPNNILSATDVAQAIHLLLDTFMRCNQELLEYSIPPMHEEPDEDAYSESSIIDAFRSEDGRSAFLRTRNFSEQYFSSTWTPLSEYEIPRFNVGRGRKSPIKSKGVFVMLLTMMKHGSKSLRWKYSRSRERLWPFLGSSMNISFRIMSIDLVCSITWRGLSAGRRFSKLTRTLCTQLISPFNMPTARLALIKNRKRTSITSKSFRAKDNAQLTSAMGWIHGKTQRNGYKCLPFTACCMLLHSLAYHCRWKHLQYVFGMRSSALSEVFWELVETFIEIQGHLITDLRGAFWHQEQNYTLIPSRMRVLRLVAAWDSLIAQRSKSVDH